jgi:hypothetical protein
MITPAMNSQKHSRDIEPETPLLWRCEMKSR